MHSYSVCCTLHRRDYFLTTNFYFLIPLPFSLSAPLFILVLNNSSILIYLKEGLYLLEMSGLISQSSPNHVILHLLLLLDRCQDRPSEGHKKNNYDPLKTRVRRTSGWQCRGWGSLSSRNNNNNSKNTSNDFSVKDTVLPTDHGAF